MIYNFAQIELKEALSIYSNFAKTEEGKGRILNQREFLSKEEIEEKHKFIKLFENFEEEYLTEISELKIFLRPILEEPNYVFNEKELFLILKRIGYLEKLKENLKKLKDPLAEKFISSIFDTKKLEPFEELFSEEGLLKKDANENLKKLNKKEKLIFSQIQKTLEKEIEKYRNYLSEHTIMFKDERYCLPVKKIHQRKVEGIFWGISNSKETAFIEPTSLLNLNNLYRSVLSEIEAEKQKICQEITDEIKRYLEEILKSLDTLYEIDFFNSLAKFKKNFKGVLPEIVEKEEGINLVNSYHPLLLWLNKDNPSKVIPLNLNLKPPKKCLILTGPNGGGKTIALKTVGLMIGLALMGFPLIARDGTKIPHIEKLFISIGDSQDLTKGLSSFTSVISNLSVFLQGANDKSFCLLDEVGFGTNPDEGAALGISILKGLADKNCYIIAATHIDYIKFLSLEDERFLNGSMAFDEKTGFPTFEFIKDFLGKSNAITIAEKFGLPKEIIEKAKGYLNKKSIEIETLLEKLGRLTKERMDELENLKNERENTKRLIEKINEERVKEREKLISDFENFKKEYWEKLNIEIENLRKEGFHIGKRKEERLIINLTPKNPLEEKEEVPFPFFINSKVFHKTLKKIGVLKRIEGEIGIVEIEGKNVWVNLKELESRFDEERKSTVNFVLKKEEVKNSLNLIGKRVEEAQDEIDIFLDNSIKYGIKKVKIIHGHGTGKLRRGIREYLKNHPLVSKFGAEEGDGATWVEIKNE